MSELDKYTSSKPEGRPVEKQSFTLEDVDRIIREREAAKAKQQPMVEEHVNPRGHPIYSEQSSEALEEMKPERKQQAGAQRISERDEFLEQKQETAQESSVESKEEDAVFTKKDRLLHSKRKLRQMKSEGKRLRRGEKKDIENLEFDKTSKTRTMYVVLAVIGIIFVGFIRQYLPNQAMYSIILLMGMMLFFPCGVIAGWLLLDPFMRCKILRRMSKRNYGVVGFVGKGMKAVLKIKNFDDGLIWRDKACWVITKDKIVQVTKEGNALTNKERVIDPECVITLVDTIPMIFVDLDSMEPLMLHQKGREAVYPLEIGATLKAWEDNQRAKIMALKKAQDILLYIAIICAAGAIVVGFLNLQKIEAMGKELTVIHGMLSNNSLIH